MKQLGKYKGKKVRASYLEWGDIYFIEGTLNRFSKHNVWFQEVGHELETMIKRKKLQIDAVNVRGGWESVKF